MATPTFFCRSILVGEDLQYILPDGTQIDRRALYEHPGALYYEKQLGCHHATPPCAACSGSGHAASYEASQAHAHGCGHESCVQKCATCWGTGKEAHEHLCVITPNGHRWDIDSRASNCTLPGDVDHRCWVRHGNPETDAIHVDKNGRTCGAGAGSIMVPGYHGFLHNGVLTDNL